MSAIIPAYNAELSLARCIDHALSQTYSSIEIIVVNDGSEDGTEEIALNYDNRIRYVRQENRGETAARNRGFEMAKGEFITFIDHDDYWHEEFVEKTVSFLKQHPVAVAVSVGRRSYSALRDTHVRPEFLENPSAETMEPLVLESFFDFWSEHAHICCGSALIRSSLFDKAGGQREDLVLSGDMEYWAYLSTFGSWGFIPEILLTTDGTQIRRGGNYYRKFKNRYQRVLTVEQWQSRILPRISGEDERGFKKLRGRIATWYTFADIFVGRDARAKQCATSYKKDLEGPYGRLWRLGLAAGWLTWKPMCLLVRLRTYLQYRFAERRLAGI
ncbi:MAG: glycosyltransferase family 2 protein [Acidobacteria bacterium]|nr:glycosyltransferase family 2 protein [Acidobacteriota bacterium]